MDISSIPVDTLVLVSVSIPILAFLVSWYRGLDTWLFIDFLFSAVCGLLWYLLPQFILGTWMVATPDVTHLAYGRLLGANTLGVAVMKYFVRSSKDKATLATLIFTNIIACTVFLITIVYNHFTSSDMWNQNITYCMIFGVALTMVGNLVFYIPLCYSGGHSQLQSRLNLILRTTGALILVSTCTFMAFPELLLKINTTLESSDAAHLFLIRLAMSETVGCAAICLLAPGFLFESDKRALFLGNMACIALMMPVVSYATFMYEDWGGRGNIVGYLLECVAGVILLLGYFSPHETDGYKTK